MPNKIIVLEDFYHIRLVHVKEIRRPTPNDRIPHSHDHCEMFIHIAGNMDIFAEKNTYHLSSGEIRIYAAGELHCGHINKEQYVEWYQIDFPPEFSEFEGSAEFLKIFFEREFGTENVFLAKDHEKICELLREIFACKEDDLISKYFYQSAIIQILCRTWYAAKSSRQAKEQEKIIDNKRNVLHEIIDIINEEYAQINSIEELCSRTHYSSSYINRIFREGMNLSPYQFLIGKKLNEAKKQLKSGASVAEACEDAGFQNYSNFITLFKKKFGITPKQYGKL